MARQRLLVVVDHFDHVTGGYEPQLRAIFDATCQKLDIELVLLVGGPLEDPNPVGAAHARVYDLLDQTSATGVIVLGSGISAYTGPERLLLFRDLLGPIPMCAVGCMVPGVPSVVVDNRPGMAALVEHLITVHGRRRLAFISGPPKNPDSEARFEVFREVLARHGIEFDPKLFAVGYFHTPSGAKAALELVASGVPFDGLVVCNDAMALSATEVLRSRGTRIPRDVAVTGFDDLAISRLASPPLTTVRQPLERIGEVAIGIILDQLAGRPVPERVELPVEFVPRASCGCDERGAVRVARSAPAAVSVAPESPRARLRAATTRGADVVPPPWEARLCEALEVELSGTTGEFLDALEDTLEQGVEGQDSFERLQRWVMRLRREDLGPALEPLWDPAERMIESAMTRSQARQRLTADVVFQNLLRSGERLLTASLDAGTLRRVVAEELTELRIRNACVALYSADDRKELTPFLWLEEGKQRTLDEGFPSALLLPPTASSRRRTYCVLPLTYESEQLGLAAFELGSGPIVFPMLVGQISAALKNVALHQEIVRTTTLHERSVQERLATAERMASLSVLAGGVAHDLNNALGPLVTLPDVILTELDELKAGTLTDDSELRLDVATIKSSALRAAQTIKDLMLLGRPGATAKQPIDLNEVVAAAMSPESLRFLAPRAQSVRLQLELSVEPLIVNASEPHVLRAIGNLVRNGTEAIAGNGQVSVRTGAASLSVTLGLYELIPPGDYATIVVTDSGAGISAPDLGRIFEPFFSRKRLVDSSGSGLGLAIVHGVVKEHSGFVDVVSKVGEGTTFTLYFPRASGAPISERVVPVTPGGSARILIVDDEPIQLQAARRVLRHLGYQVDTLQSGVEALARFASEHRRRTAGGTSVPPGLSSPYDLVIVDYALNEKHNGLETLERIRMMFPSQRGIMVSGHGRAEHEGFGTSVPWLPKPYSAETLARMVKRALDSNPPPSGG